MSSFRINSLKTVTICKLCSFASDVTVLSDPYFFRTSRICAPSYVLQEGTLQTNIITDAEGLIINILLLQGWTLSIPDYEGANSSFGAGRVAGHGVLDGIKAALSFSALGLSSNSKILGCGAKTFPPICLPTFSAGGGTAAVRLRPDGQLHFNQHTRLR